MKRVLLAGVLGGIAMFVWSSIAHIALPLGRTGIKEIPNEQGVLSGMQAQLGGNSGFYAFPGMNLGPNPTREEENAAMQQYEQKLAVSPSGILIYHPPGAKSLTVSQLMTEFLTEMAEGLLLAWLLAQTTLATFASRMGFVVVAAIMATITTNLPYWNWYGFPSSYTEAYMGIQFVGYLLAGAVVAAILRMKAAASMRLAVAV
ncbi:MAG: hypothetical protein WAL32_06540 [Terriglobales bacterium]